MVTEEDAGETIRAALVLNFRRTTIRKWVADKISVDRSTAHTGGWKLERILICSFGNL